MSHENDPKPIPPDQKGKRPHSDSAIPKAGQPASKEFLHELPDPNLPGIEHPSSDEFAYDSLDPNVQSTERPPSAEFLAALPEPGLPGEAHPSSNEMIYELPDASKLDFSDSNSEMPALDLRSDSAFAFELPDAPITDSGHGNQTVGVSLESLGDIPGLANLVPGVDPISAHELTIPTEPVPQAEPASGTIPPPADVPFVVDDPEAAVGNLEPINPVVPGSGWYDPPPIDIAAGVDSSDSGFEHARSLEQGSDIGSSLGTKSATPQASPVEGSDIFAAGPVPMAAGAEQSDVIAATAHTPPPVGEEASAPIGPVAPNRPSDVAISFDQPPGGSTVQDAAAYDDLPVADESGGSSDSLFDIDGATSAFDSARLAETPDLATEHDEDADLGSTPNTEHDASSILSAIDPMPRSAAAQDSSSIRLEAPGMEKSIPIEPLPEADAPYDLIPGNESAPRGPLGRGSKTEPDFEVNLPEDAHPSDSNLFSQARTAPDMYIPEDSGRMTSPSSIFSGGKVPGDSGGDLGRSDHPLSDARGLVEFPEHPDARNADSSDLHSPVAEASDAITFDNPLGRPPGAQDSGMIDWSAPGDEGATFAAATPASGIVPPTNKAARRGPDPENGTDDMPLAGEARPVSPKRKSSPQTPPVPQDQHDPAMVVDWVAESGEKVKLPPAKRGSKPVVDVGRDPDDTGDESRLHPAKRSSGGRGAVGVLLGTVLGLGIGAGAYFSGLVPNGDGSKSGGSNPGGNTNPNGGTTPPPAAAATFADAKAALAGGDPVKALQMIRADAPANPDIRTVRGEAGLLTARREASPDAAFVPANDPKLAAARTDLTTAIQEYDAAKTPDGEKGAVRATLQLGLSHEVAGDRSAAQKVYEDGLRKYPKAAEMFQTALDRLAATAPADGKVSRLTPAEVEQLVQAVIVLTGVGLADQPPAVEPAEAGPQFWKAVNLATIGKYTEAIDQIGKAKASHQKRARAIAGRGLNPLSDPLEQIFPRCCDDLKAYWELKKVLYEHPGVKDIVAKQGVSKALDQMLTAEKRATDAVKLAADLKTGNDLLRTEIKTASDKVRSLEGDLKAEKANVTKLEKDIKGEKDKVTTLVKDVKLENDKRLAIEKDLKAAKEAATTLADKLKKADDAVVAANAARKDAESTLVGVANELQGGKLLPEKYNAAAIVAATRSAVSRATGPDLTKLIPPGLAAVAGAGLTTGHIIDLADRVNKFDVAAKAAETKYVKATADHKKELDKVKTDNDAEVKKIKDGFAADVKKLTDAQTDEIKKLKDANVVTVDKLKDGFAADMKKLTDKYIADMKKQADAYDAKVKVLETEVQAERDRTAAAVKKAQIDLANAFTPAQALDMWLPMLTTLRRPSDADAALEAANKVLKVYPADSEDAAKAMTVSGLALMLKGDTERARQMFAQARKSPAYRLAGGKAEWVKTLDVGLASIDDPTAPLRRPVEGPHKDVLAAARFLDQGIAAYKAGRYSEAETALVAAAWNDEADPLAWYFLGATRWAAGKADGAKEAFEQGSEREKARTMPTRVIDVAISPIQGAARDALNRARP